MKLIFRRQARPSGGIKKKNVKKIVSIVLLIVAALSGSFFAYGKLSKKTETEVKRTATVKRGDIVKVIEGSGTIEAINQYEVTSLVDGDIIADYFEEGQFINKGDLMYVIDASDVEDNIKKAENSLEKAKLTYNESLESLNDLNIKAGISGVIKELYIKENDTVQSGTKVADIVNGEEMLLKINFLAEDAANIHVGDSATVNLEGTFTSLEGKVVRIASGSLTNSYGVMVTPVEISVKNPGGILPGDTATAIVGDYACNEAGTFEYSEEYTVLAKKSGTVKTLNYKQGDRVEKNSVIAKLEDEDALSSIKQNKIALEDAEIELGNSYKQLENYKITAPISGKVIKKSYKAGEKISKSSSESTAMAIIADLSTLVFDISVDELDIAKIKVGQEVSITADALEGRTFSGYISNISIVGTSSNGVTTYPVTVVVNDGENTGLIPGMNVNANIEIDARYDVLTIPASAVERGNMVKVVTSKKSQSELEYNSVRVETGLTDGTNIEIISGLNEGDEVILPDKQSSTTTNAMPGGGMPGGIRGGMPPAGGGPR